MLLNIEFKKKKVKNYKCFSLKSRHALPDVSLVETLILLTFYLIKHCICITTSDRDYYVKSSSISGEREWDSNRNAWSVEKPLFSLKPKIHEKSVNTE